MRVDRLFAFKRLELSMAFDYQSSGYFKLGGRHHYHPLQSFRLLECGVEYFPALELAIAQAKAFIYLEVYIFANDEIGSRISRALIEAAKRGVNVKVIVDWVGSPNVAFIDAWRQAGIQFRYYNPSWVGIFGISRTHRKLVVMDGLNAFVGGINICSDYLDVSGRKLSSPRWDFAAQVGGLLAQEIQRAFEWQWDRIHRPAFKWHPLHSDLIKKKSSLANLKEDGVGAFIARDNFHYRRDIEKAYLKTIGAAKSEIYLINPYFLPGRKLTNALLAAVKRGVRVNLMVGVGQFKWLDYAVKAIYGVLLKGGVVVYEYIGSELHGKILVADERWLTVGSSNCDPLSFLVNHEANLIVVDRVQALWLIEKIQHEIQINARLVNPEVYFRRSILQKLGQWIAYLLSRILTRVLVQGVRTKVNIIEEENYFEKSK